MGLWQASCPHSLQVKPRPGTAYFIDKNTLEQHFSVNTITFSCTNTIFSISPSQEPIMGFCPSVLLKFSCMFLCFCTIVLLCSFMVIGRRKRQARASGAPQLRKFGNLSIRKSFVMTSAFSRTLTIQTLGEGEGSQESARWGRSML